jgi:hypothetical protein
VPVQTNKAVNSPIRRRVLNFFIFFAILFLGFQTTVTPAKAAVQPTCTATNERADVDCRCPKNMCRLSTFSSDTRWWIDPSRISSPGSFTWSCVAAGQTLSNSGEFAQYNSEAYLANLKLTPAAGQSIPKFFTDDFNNDLVQKYIPEKSICKGDPNDPNGVAYWYYPLFFENVMKGGSGSATTCENGATPILVTRDLFGKPVRGVNTFFGCLPGSVNGAVAFVLRLGLGVATVVTVLIVLVNLIKMIGSSVNPDAVAEARKKMVSGIFSLLALYLTLTILSVIGLQILDLGTMGGSLLRVFTGG